MLLSRAYSSFTYIPCRDRPIFTGILGNTSRGDHEPVQCMNRHTPGSPGEETNKRSLELDADLYGAKTVRVIKHYSSRNLLRLGAGHGLARIRLVARR